MKKLEIELKDETYEKIKKIIDWINLDNSFNAKNDTPEAEIEDFIKGAIVSKIEDVDTLTPLFKPEMSKNIVIKNRFKEIAKRKKIKQVEICQRTGIKKANLSLIFNNEKTLRADTFFVIWIILGCPSIHKCLYTEEVNKKY